MGTPLSGILRGIGGLIILAGLLLGALRVGLPPLASAYRTQLVGLVAERTGLALEVDTLELAFRGWQPELLLEGVRLGGEAPGSPHLDLQRLRVRLDVAASLAAGALRIAGASLTGVRLAVHLRRGGSLGVTWLERPGQDTETESLGLLLALARLDLEDGELLWIDDRLPGPPLRWVGVGGTLRREGDRLDLQAQGRLLGAQDGSVTLGGSLVGDPAGPEGLSGELYLRLTGRDLARVLALQAGWGLDLHTGGGVESWVRIEGGRLGRLVQRWQLQDLVLSQPGGKRLGVESLGALLGWRAREQGWDLDVRDLTLRRKGSISPNINASLALERGSEGEVRLALGVDRLDLADLAALAPLLAEGTATWAPLVEGMRPSGTAQGLKGVARRTAGEPWRWSGEVDLVGVAAEPWGAWPGVRGLDAALKGDVHLGAARLHSTDLELRFPQLFRQPLQAATLAGELGWEIDAEGRLLDLWGPALRVENPDLATESAFAVRLPLKGGDPWLQIQTRFRDGNAASTGRYLPVGIMPPRVVAWLDRAIRDGRIPSGEFRLQGPASAFPYREGQGAFEVSFTVEDLVLDYQAGWPRLERLGAQVRFLNQGLEIHADQGRILQTPILQADAHIPDLERAPVLRVSGRTAGPLADGLRLLRESPLAAQTGRYVRGMTGRGDGRLALDLTLPLDQAGAEQVATTLSWQGEATLVLMEGALSLEQPRGTLGFANGKLSSKGVQARLWGQPLELDLATLEERGKRLTRLEARARLGPQHLARQYPSPTWQWLKGETPWRLRLEFPHRAPPAEGPVGFLLESDLKGLELALPAPLGKASAAKRPFALEGELGAGPGLRLNSRYGGFWASLGWERTSAGWRLLGGELGSGKAAFPASLSPGLRVRADLDALDGAEWGRWWLDQGEEVGSAAGSGPALERLELGVKRLDLGALRCTDARLRLGGDDGGRWLSLEAPQLAGRLALPGAGGDAFVATLERLDLRALEQDRQGPAASPAPDLDPRRLPPLRIEVADLRWGQAQVGRLELQSRPDPKGMRLERLALVGPLATLEGSGQWLQGTGGGRTQLGLQGRSAEVGKLLEQLGLNTSIERAPLEASLSFGWPGAPYAPGLAGLEGRLEFRFGAGSLLDVDPGLGRVLGILNLGALRRRLTLDFRDLFGKGSSFDSIEGLVVLDGRVARTERLQIDAPSAEVRVQGQTDLVSRQLDQRVTVIPDLSSSLLVAGAVVGGPLVGAAVLVADQVIGKQVDKLSQYQYRVTGTWENPVFERVGAGAEPLPDPPGAPQPGPPADEASASPFLDR